MGRHMLTIREVAAYLNVTSEAIELMILKAEIPYHRNDAGEYRFDVDEIDRWVCRWDEEEQ